MKPFLDTNILVYAALSDDPRRPTAERLLAAGGTISVQVLNEFANVAREANSPSSIRFSKALREGASRPK